MNSIQIPAGRGIVPFRCSRAPGGGPGATGQAVAGAGPVVRLPAVQAHISAWLEDVRVAEDTCAICVPTFRCALFWNSERYPDEVLSLRTGDAGTVWLLPDRNEISLRCISFYFISDFLFKFVLRDPIYVMFLWGLVHNKIISAGK